jgi:hypothetical protein
MLRTGIYAGIYAGTNMCAITKCMLSKHLFAAEYAYIANLALKINVKLGGSNFYIVFRFNVLTF